MSKGAAFKLVPILETVSLFQELGPCRDHFYRTQVSLGSDLWVLMSPCADLTDVTLADEDSNSTPADYGNRTILGNVAMQVAPPGGQN